MSKQIRTLMIGTQSEYREAVPAVKYRDKLIERYGEERARLLCLQRFLPYANTALP